MLPGNAPSDVSQISSAGRAFSITPGPNLLPNVTRAIYVGGYGDLEVVTEGNDEVVLVGLAAGLLHSIRVKRVLAGRTTATNIVGFF